MSINVFAVQVNKKKPYMVQFLICGGLISHEQIICQSLQEVSGWLNVKILVKLIVPVYCWQQQHCVARVFLTASTLQSYKAPEIF